MEAGRIPSADELSELVHARATQDSPAARLTAAIELVRAMDDSGDEIVGRCVADARADGLTWTQIGSLFGTSKQAAQKRFGTAARPLGAWPGRWTPAALLVLEHATEQARRLGHESIGTEHALLGLLAVPEDVAAQVLSGFGVGRQGVLAELYGPCKPLADGCLRVLPRFKQALESAHRVAARLGHPVASTEHLLAGILAVPGSFAVEILEHQGADPDAVRHALAARLGVDERQLIVPRPNRRRLLTPRRR